MGRLKSIFIILFLTILTLSFSFACNLLNENNRSTTINTGKETDQPQGNKLMMGTVGQGYIRVSVDSNSKQLTNASTCPTISSDGRFVAFTTSTASVFIFDRVNKQLIPLEGPDYLYTENVLPDLVSFSADGRYVAFSSKRNHLVPEDLNGNRDIFVRDMQTGTVVRVNVGSDNLLPPGQAESVNPRISADGRIVAFISSLALMVHGDYFVNDGIFNVFARDLQAEDTRLASRDYGLPAGADGRCLYMDITPSGRFVVYNSFAINLTKDYLYTKRSNVFVNDVQYGLTQLVSVAMDGKEPNGDSYTPSISDDARYIAFISDANNLFPNTALNNRNLFVRDMVNNVTTLVVANFGDTPVGVNQHPGRTANGYCWVPRISGNGRYVTFIIIKQEDRTGPFDIVVHDLKSGLTTKVASSAGDAYHYWRYAPSISSDGNYVAFASDQDNLVADDTNGVTDVFVYYQNVNLKPPVTPGIQTIKPPLEAPITPSSPTNKPHTLETPLQHK